MITLIEKKQKGTEENRQKWKDIAKKCFPKVMEIASNNKDLRNHLNKVKSVDKEKMLKMKTNIK